MPACIAMRNPVIAVLLRPIPPLVEERRKDGTQLLSPHQANMVKPFMSVSAQVMRKSPGSAGVPSGEFENGNTPAGTPALPAFVFLQTSGSGTRRRIQNVRKAGKIPTKNTTRQLRRSEEH